MDGLSSTVILRITTLYSKKIYQSSDHRFPHDSWMIVSKISKRIDLVFPISKRQLNLSCHGFVVYTVNQQVKQEKRTSFLRQ